MKYRSDIDGLRAIAVTAVVAFHVGLPGWQDGFAGIDVFFVISGFLIGTLLLDEHAAKGRISFLDFYARRMRRILPAMFVVVAATVLAAVFLLNPLEQQRSTMEAALASTLFLANIFFWRTTGGYFDDTAETMPLLNMWSLGVEEQWYMVFPLLLVGLLAVLARVGKTEADRSRKLLLVFGLILLASFILCVLATAYRPRAAFFILPTRAWEFLAGVCVGIALRLGCEIEMGDGLQELRAVVVVARWGSILGNNIDAQSSEITRFLSNEDLPLGRGAALGFAEDRLPRFAELLAAQNIRMLLVFPSPVFPHSVPACLARRNENECGVGHAQVEEFTSDIRAVFSR